MSTTPTSELLAAALTGIIDYKLIKEVANAEAALAGCMYSSSRSDATNKGERFHSPS